MLAHRVHGGMGGTQWGSGTGQGKGSLVSVARSGAGYG